MTRLRAFSLIVTLFCLTTMLSACTNAVLFTTASIIGIEMNTAVTRIATVHHLAAVKLPRVAQKGRSSTVLTSLHSSQMALVRTMISSMLTTNEIHFTSSLCGRW